MVRTTTSDAWSVNKGLTREFGGSFTKAGSLHFQSFHNLNQLLPMLSDFVFFRILHVFNVLQDAMYIPSARLDTNSVGPADFQMTYGSPVALADIE